MRFDDLSKPVSDDKPAGPDLDDEMDTAYMNYTLLAPDRLPTSFLVSVPGTDERKPFDRSSIEIGKEVDTIAELLERTRDLRLLMLDGRFNAAAGRFVEFTESTQGIALLVNTFWDDVHPKPADGDMIVRQNTVESLDDLGQVVLHLQNSVLAGGGRTRQVSLRHYLVATGKAQAREGEESVSIGEISATMTNEANAARVAEVHAAIEASRVALDAIRTTFLDKAGPEYTPSFPNLLDLYKQMIEMIGAYRTDLVPTSVTTEGTEEYAMTDGGAATLPAGSVKTHADATAALIAAESYFLRMEPSSPALILVHQARMLVGQPLTFALEALMPEPSNRAALRFDSGFKFDIDLSRMKLVTDDALSNGIPEAPPDESSSASSSTDDGWGSSSSSSDDGWGSSESSDDGWGSSDSSDSASDSSSSETPAESADPAASESSDDGWGSSDSSDADSAASSESEAQPEPEPEPEPAAPPPPPEPTGPTVFVARTRGQASELMHATELFYRAAEPSSAIPLLLSKARGYVSKDFAAILSELIPREQESSY